VTRRLCRSCVASTRSRITVTPIYVGRTFRCTNHMVCNPDRRGRAITEELARNDKLPRCSETDCVCFGVVSPSGVNVRGRTLSTADFNPPTKSALLGRRGAERVREFVIIEPRLRRTIGSAALGYMLNREYSS
jgi:hypothetical protein